MHTPLPRSFPGLCRQLFAAVVACVAMDQGYACEDATKHPGSEAYLALRDSLMGQPRGPVQVMYKLGERRFKGLPVPVRLHFWPISDYDEARLQVTPSEGLELAGLEGSPEVPFKGALEFVVTPKANGFHFLKVDVIARENDVEIRHTSAIPVSAGGHGDGFPQMSPDKPYGFAGPELIEALKNPRTPADPVDGEQ